jgi:tyrosinase
VGPADIKATEAHNAQMNSLPEATINKYLNGNVQNWLGFGIQPHDGNFVYTGTRQKFAKCLEASNYTVFSSTTSAMQWNEDHFDVEAWSEPLSPSPAPEAAVPIESSHNDIHLSIGGYEVKGQGNFDAIQGANGDMGENESARQLRVARDRGACYL